METFGSRLRKLIDEKDIQYKDFAKILRVAPSTISNWLNGDRFPNDEKILTIIADFFNVTTDYLLCRTDNKNNTLSEYIVNDQRIKISYNNDNFPDGMSDNDKLAYGEIGNALKSLGLVYEDLAIIKRFRELKLELKDLDQLSEIKKIVTKFNVEK